MAKYDAPEKEEVRVKLLTAAVENLKARGMHTGDLTALVLVDGIDEQVRDVEVLETLGVSRSHVTVVSQRWADNVRPLYAGSTIVESELSRALELETKDASFHIVYFDFCKPLPNEPAEHQVSALFNLFRHGRLAERSVLITNFAIKGYFDLPLYREFMRAYVAPDFWSDGGVSRMSIRTLSAGVNRMGGDLFTREEKIREGDTTMEQKTRILAAFMDNFVSDIAEVYVPASSVSPIRPFAELLAELDEFVASNVNPMDCPPEMQRMMKKRACLMGQIAQCARLLEKAPAEVTEHLRPYTRTTQDLLALAVQTEHHPEGWRLRHVYHPHLEGGMPYPANAYNMLPLLWSVERFEEVMSWELWGEDALRRRQGLIPSPFRSMSPNGPRTCARCGFRGPTGDERPAEQRT